MTKERSIRREVPAGEAVPNVYGLAYRAYDRNVSICYPIPINMVVATARRLWKWCQGGYSYQFCRPSKVSHIVLSGQEQHELFNYLTPFIEKSGKTWKVTTRDGSQFISDVIIE